MCATALLGAGPGWLSVVSYTKLVQVDQNLLTSHNPQDPLPVPDDLDATCTPSAQGRT